LHGTPTISPRAPKKVVKAVKAAPGHAPAGRGSPRRRPGKGGEGGEGGAGVSPGLPDDFAGAAEKRR